MCCGVSLKEEEFEALGPLFVLKTSACEFNVHCEIDVKLIIYQLSQKVVSPSDGIPSTLIFLLPVLGTRRAVRITIAAVKSPVQWHLLGYCALIQKDLSSVCPACRTEEHQAWICSSQSLLGRGSTIEDHTIQFEGTLKRHTLLVTSHVHFKTQLG